MGILRQFIKKYVKKRLYKHIIIIIVFLFGLYVDNNKQLTHIVPFGKFHRIGGTPPKTFTSDRYDVPEEVGGDRKCFDSPIRK